MKTYVVKINYGCFVGADEWETIEAEDLSDLEEQVEQIIIENCGWEIENEEDEEDE